MPLPGTCCFRPSFVRPQNMPCRHCSSHNGRTVENPYRDVEPVVQDYHSGVCLASCGYCSQSALHYWVDIYDDCLHYWCNISQQEVQTLRDLAAQWEEDSGDYLALIEARLIIREKTVLYAQPVHGNCWTEGESCILEGAPW